MTQRQVREGGPLPVARGKHLAFLEQIGQTETGDHGRLEDWMPDINFSQ